MSSVQEVEPTDRTVEHHEVIVVGAGFGGLGVAVELRRIGIDDVVLLEKAHDLGGTWRDNTYPGLEVDIPSFTYSYKFALRKGWSQVYAPGSEVKAYADEIADRFDLRKHIRYGCEVTAATWDEAARRWLIGLSDGRALCGNQLVVASGYLSCARRPDIDGFEDFTGTVMHTAEWDHSHDLDGKRVAIIGTGATAIQLAPAIADRLSHLDIYQRTAIWLAPKPNRTFGPAGRRAMALPGVQRALRAVNWFATEVFFGLAFVNYRRFPGIMRRIEGWLVDYIRREVHDPDLQEKLIPTYSFFCKRPSFSNTYYALFNRDDVELVTEPISHIAPSGIVTRDGALRPVDAIVCATGFKVFDRTSSPPFEVRGAEGLDLAAWWDEHRYQAFRGTTIPGFPNLFYIVGPYSAAGASFFDVLDNQVIHISRVLRAAQRRNATRVEVRRRAHDRDFRAVQRRGRSMVLHAGDCATSNSYYFDRHGDTPGGPRPATPTEHWIRSRLFRVGASYDFR